MKTIDGSRSIDAVSGGRARRRAASVLAALLAVLLMSPAGAQAEKALKEYALIYGTVWGTDNRPVSGVVVKIQRVGERKPQWERISDRRGEFALRVPVGVADYVLFAEVGSGKSKKRIEAKAHIEANERVDVSLHLTE